MAEEAALATDQEAIDSVLKSSKLETGVSGRSSAIGDASAVADVSPVVDEGRQMLFGEVGTLDGEITGDEFAGDAVNYQILLGKIDALLDRLKLDA